MKAANTAGTLMNRRNWSIDSIRHPPSDKNASPAALLHRVR